MAHAETPAEDLVHVGAAASRLGVSRRTADRLMADGLLLRARGSDGRAYVTADSLAAVAHRRERPLRRGAASDELNSLLSAMERLVGAMGNERAAVTEAVFERDRARTQAAELRGELAVERARNRRLEDLLLTLASERSDSSALAREVLRQREEAVKALSEPEDACAAAERLFELTTAAEPKTVDELRAAFAEQLDHVRGDLRANAGVDGDSGGGVRGGGDAVCGNVRRDGASERWSAWRVGHDIPGAVYERLVPGAERRVAGQFQTPFPLADVMAAWLLQEPTRKLLDPAVGSGRLLFRAHMHPRQASTQAPVEVIGWDVDELAIAMAELNLRVRGIPRFKLHHADFLLDEGPAAAELAADPPDAVISNPPWSRASVLDPAYRRRVGEGLERRLGISLSRQAGLHAIFLLRAVEVAAPGARLAFLSPADWLDAAYGRAVQNCLLDHTRIEGYVKLSKQRLPFDGVLATAAITFLRKTPDSSAVTKVIELGDSEPEPARVLAALSGEDVGLRARDVQLSRTGSLSRSRRRRRSGAVALGELARVHRGIATGHNRFFVITEAVRRQRGIEIEMLRACLYQPRLFSGLDAPEIHQRDLDSLADLRPRWLIDPPEDFREHEDTALGEYLAYGKRELRVHERHLCKQRPIWFRPENRGRCPIVVAVMHKHAQVRFLRNHSTAVPLASFHIIEPHDRDPSSADRLWEALNKSSVENALRALGRHYGNSMWKVEPGDVSQLTVSRPELSSDTSVAREP